MMIKVTIKRLDIPKTIAYTNTGMVPFVPKVETFSWIEVGMNPKAVYLEFEEEWTMFSPELMRVVSWYARSYFSNSINLDINVRIH